MKKDIKINDEPDQRIVRFLNGQLSAEEQERLEKWIEASEENRDIFRTYQNIWLGTSGSLHSNEYNPEKAWKTVASGIHKPTFRQIYESKRQTRKLYNRIARIAAVSLAIFAFGAILSYLALTSNPNLAGGNIYEVSTPLGSRSKIVLPDSSIVWLNAGSTISYSNYFSRAGRIVELKGEGYFDVTTNPRRPFVVKTPHLNVKALGTQFNVKAYPDEDIVMTTLVSGKVIVEIPESGRLLTYDLSPKQNFTYKITEMDVSETIVDDYESEEKPEPYKIPGEVLPQIEQKAVLSLKSNVRPELYTSWKDETWVIEGESMCNMAQMLGRRFNIQININSQELERYRFTGIIMNETLEQVLEILRMTTPLKYDVGKGIVDWDIDPKLKDDYDTLINKPIS